MGVITSCCLKTQGNCSVLEVSVDILVWQKKKKLKKKKIPGMKGPLRLSIALAKAKKSRFR